MPTSAFTPKNIFTRKKETVFFYPTPPLCQPTSEL